MNPNYSTIKTSRNHVVKQPRNVTKELSCALANTYAIYLKTQNYHWNVTGSLFGTLHRLFDEQYHELADAIDTIAERIRAVGTFAPATFKQFEDLNEIAEDREVPTAEAMLQNLAAGHEQIATRICDSIAVCNHNNDFASADLLIKRVGCHEKYAWMLRSFLKNQSTAPQAPH